MIQSESSLRRMRDAYKWEPGDDQHPVHSAVHIALSFAIGKIGRDRMHDLIEQQYERVTSHDPSDS